MWASRAPATAFPPPLTCAKSARLCAQRSTTATANFAPIDYQLSTHLNKVCGAEGASVDGINWIHVSPFTHIPG